MLAEMCKFFFRPLSVHVSVFVHAIFICHLMVVISKT